MNEMNERINETIYAYDIPTSHWQKGMEKQQLKVNKIYGRHSLPLMYE